MPNAVQLGAGNIGRGFLGHLLWEGNYRTTFVDSNAALVDALNARGGYPLRLISEGQCREMWIGNIGAVHSEDTDAVNAALLEADFVGTSVGVKYLPHVAQTLASGIAARAEAKRGPLDIFLCENQWHAANFVRELILPHLPSAAMDYFETQIGLVETVIGRMVPAPTDALRAVDPLLVVAEPYQELPVARAMMRGPVPDLPGLWATDAFAAYEARKLFLHNMSHAALAYLGYQRGYAFIWQCANDPEIRQVCRNAMREVSQALEYVYHVSPDDLNRYAADLLHRFANQALGDTVLRVAADPIRKLRLEDRLVGAAKLCIQANVIPEALAAVIAGALRYDAPDDLSAQQLQSERHQLGDASVLHSLCGIAPGTQLAGLVHQSLASQNVAYSNPIER